MTSGGESEQFFERYSIPSPPRPLFQLTTHRCHRRMDQCQLGAVARSAVTVGCVHPGEPVLRVMTSHPAWLQARS
jgi:hypothetical protein